MRRKCKFSGIITYVLIVLVVVGINMLLCMPIKNIEKNSKQVKANFEKTLEEKNVTEEISSTYNEYIEDIKEEYSALGRNYINMVVALLATLSLGLVIFGLVNRVNANRNRGIYNGIVLGGITTIFYLIYFIISASNAFEVMF